MESTLLVASAGLGTFVTMLVLRPLAKMIGLMDIPDERKLHTHKVPLVGGIAIYLVFVVLALIFLSQHEATTYFLLSATMIVLLGAVDDYADLNSRFRLLAQMAIASILVYGTDFALESLGNLFWFGDIHLGWLAIPFTLIATAGTINALNMVDGIDGLAGTLGLVCLSAIAGLCILNGDTVTSSFALILSGSVLVYLLFNAGPLSKKQKVFMGDAGSMLLGLAIVWLLAMGSQSDNPSFRPVTALWFVAVPLIDMFLVMHRRIRKGQSPLKADRDHLHHIFMRMGYSSKQALLMITCIAIFYASFGIIGEVLNFPEYVMFGLFLGLIVAYDYAFIHVWKVIRIVRAR